MLLSDLEVNKRLNSPFNLINKLNENNGANRVSAAMSLFGIGKPHSSKNENEQNTQKTETPPHKDDLSKVATLDNLIENHESQIKLASVHNKSLDLLTKSLDILSAKVDDIKADKLSAVVATASRVVEGIRKERAEASKNGQGREVHYHFYTPTQSKIEDYEIIDATPP